MPFTDAIEQALLNHVLNKATYPVNATVHVGLSSTTPDDAGANFTEPVGNGYGRQPALAAAWGNASGTAPAAITNTSVITFATATGNWAAGNMTHFGLFTALTAGTLICWGALTVPKQILSGDTASFAVSSLALRLGKTGDAGL
ncbi:MAG: phage tail fiber protein [Phycicoccus sp.]